MSDIYSSEYVEELFDKMSDSYDRMNYITSFGFSSLWRKQSIQRLPLKNSSIIVDLMTGMGECWGPLSKNVQPNTKVIAIDFSSEMIRHAENRISKFENIQIQLLKENVFQNSIKDEVADCVYSGFGLKTFNNHQLVNLASEIHRILKPGGEFNLIDVSVPKGKLIKPIYMFYLKNIIPILGKIFLGNPSTYKMLGVYTENFSNASVAREIFKTQGFEVKYSEYFFGCATGISGKKV